jgi:hypothetical protein
MAAIVIWVVGLRGIQRKLVYIDYIRPKVHYTMYQDCGLSLVNVRFFIPDQRMELSPVIIASMKTF